MRPTYDGKSGDLYATLFGVAATCFTVALVIAGLTQLADELKPGTGDIISFHPTKGVLHVQTTIAAVPAGDSPATPCILDPRVMKASGGSLVIESTQFKPSLSYRVHWAGVRTSDDGTDCGTSAELLLSQADLSALFLAADGSWR